MSERRIDFNIFHKSILPHPVWANSRLRLACRSYPTYPLSSVVSIFSLIVALR